MTTIEQTLQASHVADLGLDYLVDHRLARLREEPSYPGYPRNLVRRLDEIRDSETLVEALREMTEDAAVLLGRNWEEELQQAASRLPEAAQAPRDLDASLAEWREAAGAILLRVLETMPFDPGRPLEVHLAPAESLLISALAVARRKPALLRGENPEILLPAQPIARDELPARGSGRVEIIEVGDLLESACALGHEEVFAELEPWAGSIRWRWLHGPTGFHENSYFAAGIAEVVAEQDPAGFWTAIELLYDQRDIVEVGSLSQVLPGLRVDPLTLRERAVSPEITALVARDHTMALVCAIPAMRPAFVIGRKLFLRSGQADAIRAEVERILAQSGSEG